MQKSNFWTGIDGKSGEGPPPSGTLVRSLTTPDGAKRFGVRQPSGALGVALFPRATAKEDQSQSKCVKPICLLLNFELGEGLRPP
jgi:hypothetical protein